LGIGDGDWGLGMGIGDWGLGPIPNPPSPIPNPQSPIIIFNYNQFLIKLFSNILYLNELKLNIFKIKDKYFL